MTMADDVSVSAAAPPAAGATSTTTATATALQNSTTTTSTTTGTTPNTNNPNSTTTTNTTTSNIITAKLSQQLKKLQEANGKYKSLLKLAKERIQQQEDELLLLRQQQQQEQQQQQQQQVSEHEQQQQQQQQQQRMVEKKNEAELFVNTTATANNISNDAAAELNIVRVCQRVKVRSNNTTNYDDNNINNNNNINDEIIWALVEMELVPNSDYYINTNNNNIIVPDYKRYKEWKRFDTESALEDFIRRDTGEPVMLPPYSLSPNQSLAIQEQAALQVNKITEEFRRFRVRSELARKQADAQIRDLQMNSVNTATRRIVEGSSGGADGMMQHTNNNHNHHHYGSSSSHQELAERARQQAAGGQLERLRAEMVAQEAHWKEAYDMLLAENKALKSSGSEALLAAQWRQRYETLQKDKDELESKLSDKTGDRADQSKYEEKYRDLKESFRLYRKKAKEIFEAQLNGTVDASSPAAALNSMITSSSSADAKLSYLKNLMVNYFTSDHAMQDHMQTAIGTVLQFSPEEIGRIEKKRAENEAWF